VETLLQSNFEVAHYADKYFRSIDRIIAQMENPT